MLVLEDGTWKKGEIKKPAQCAVMPQNPTSASLHGEDKKEKRTTPKTKNR